ncbi:MAG: arylsulfatase A-like enzyme [Planctomycetota bacterium]|jgi:arylsulfatase A-like enzyme
MIVALPAPLAPFHVLPEDLHTFDTDPRHSGKIESEYKAMAEATDTEIGRLLDAVDTAGINDETYVFFIGDNGTLQDVTVPRPYPGKQRERHTMGESTSPS